MQFLFINGILSTYGWSTHGWEKGYDSKKHRDDFFTKPSETGSRSGKNKVYTHNAKAGVQLCRGPFQLSFIKIYTSIHKWGQWATLDYSTLPSVSCSVSIHTSTFRNCYIPTTRKVGTILYNNIIYHHLIVEY